MRINALSILVRDIARMKIFKTEFNAMGGANELVAAAPDELSALRAMEAAAKEVLRIEAKYSRYRPTASFLVSISLLEMHCCNLRRSNYELLNAAETLPAKRRPVRRDVWYPASGLGLLESATPTQKTLDPLLALVGWDKVDRSEKAIRLTKKGMESTSAALAKNTQPTARRKFCQTTASQADMLISAAIFVLSDPTQMARLGSIGVGNPRQKGAIVATMPVVRGALATSGDSEKYIEVDGRIYCHILNPKTGMPVNHWASATVRAPTAIMAGALTTIAMLKESAAIEFFRNSVTPFLFIDLNGQFFSNQSLSQ